MLVTRTVQTRIGIRNIVMPGRAHLEDRHEEVDAAQDRARPDQRQAHDPEVLAGPGRGQRPVLGQRRVARPAGRCRAAGDEAEEQQDAAERQHPERQGVDPRERHVRRADLERHDVVPEADQHRDDEQEDHHRPVHREELVVDVLVGEELDARLGQLGPDEEGEDPGEEEEDERVDEVEDPDLLVIGRREPLVQPAPVGGGGGRQRGGRHRSSLLDRQRAEHERRMDRALELVGPGGQRRHAVVADTRPREVLPVEDLRRRTPSRMSTSCGVPASWLSKWIVNGASAGAVELRLVELDVLRGEVDDGTAAATARDRRRRRAGRRELARRTRPGTSAGAMAWTSNTMIRWPTPHSSAHWPRNVWPASSASMVRSNWLTMPGTTSRLNRNCGT